MGLVRLAVCVIGVYSAFLWWAIAQERLSVPFPSIHHPLPSQPPLPDDPYQGDRFPSPLFLNYTQAVASCSSAFVYLLISASRSRTYRARSYLSILGLSQLAASLKTMKPRASLTTPPMMSQAKVPNGHDGNGTINRNEPEEREFPVKRTPWSQSLPALLVQVSVFQTMAGPFGFLALRHISYPTMVLGKSCKLIPVLLLNVILYRRRFSPHKYLVVALVTVGISIFMLFGEASKKAGSDSIWGLTLLVVRWVEASVSSLTSSLVIDGLTNSTQDQIFASYPGYSGQQMMFIMALIQQLILVPAIILPLPTNSWSLIQDLFSPFGTRLRPEVPSAPLALSPPAALESLTFLINHPTAISPLLAYALLGGLGQLFIFEIIQHFGSLTLVMVTVTRKLFTMLLSVVIFEHTLSTGQWIGVAIVFGGIAVEAGMKRRDMMKRTRRD